MHASSIYRLRGIVDSLITDFGVALITQNSKNSKCLVITHISRVVESMVGKWLDQHECEGGDGLPHRLQTTQQ